MKSNTQSRMNIVIGGAIGGATVTYEVIAVLGYLTFGTKVQVSFCSTLDVAKRY
jgi:amino acid permease